jgi:hypothetical protein
MAAGAHELRIRSLRLTNLQAFADSGLIPLRHITLFVGKNNAGKSAILSGIRLAQADLIPSPAELVRVGTDQARVELDLTDLPMPVRRQGADSGQLTVRVNRHGTVEYELTPTRGTVEPFKPLPAALPGAMVLPLLADTGLRGFDERVNVQTTKSIRSDVDNLPALMAGLTSAGNPRSADFVNSCEKLLGFRLGLLPSVNGQLPGLAVDDSTEIRLGSMGAGVIRMARLLVYLAHARTRILLVEEPENDLHPEALHYVLELIATVAPESQVIVTTHSHIVVNSLAAEKDCAIYSVEMELNENRIPTGTVSKCETAQERLAILRRLGNQLVDFGLFEAYLILEESSAETIVQRLMAWFVPKLVGRIRTLACYGVEDAIPRFSDLRRLFVFTHLEDIYRGRAWVVVDGDDAGRAVVEKLKTDFSDWPEEHFRSFAAPAFELFYPEPFRKRANAALGTSNRDERRRLKRELLADVIAWIDENDDRARKAFEESAASAIEILRDIELKVLETPVVAAAARALSMPPSGRWERTFKEEDEAGPPIDLTEVRKVTYRVQPGPACVTWRFGLKFTSADVIHTGRYGPGFPLWHLTKDKTDSLSVTYYDEQGASPHDVVARLSYRAEEVTVVLEVADDSVRVTVDGIPGSEMSFPLATHRRVLPTAWADGGPLEVRVNCEVE